LGITSPQVFNGLYFIKKGRKKMNAKNRFKNKVIADLVKTFEVPHPKAVQLVEERYAFTPRETTEEWSHCGDPECSCGNEVVDRISYPTHSVDLRMEDPASLYITEFGSFVMRYGGTRESVVDLGEM
jgi:hypothetical protein